MITNNEAGSPILLGDRGVERILMGIETLREDLRLAIKRSEVAILSKDEKPEYSIQEVARRLKCPRRLVRTNCLAHQIPLTHREGYKNPTVSKKSFEALRLVRERDGDWVT